jgi:DNA-binding NtrC family response regulator
MRPASTQETIQIAVDNGRRLISRSAPLLRICHLVERVAPAGVTVLITGETGTGKELIARLIHNLSPRASREFVAFDCNAVAPTLLESELFGHERGAFTGADHQRVGVFELAHGTTLFLDEIANIPLPAQTKLLRVLQEREFRRLGGRGLIHSDFRLITASNADLAACVGAGTFREDLFQRLQVVQIDLPPLRERREDIALLVSHFISEKRLRLMRPGVCRVRHEAMHLLLSYDWPGNVRELENVIESAIIECPGDTIEVSHLRLPSARGQHGLCGEEDLDLELPFRVARERILSAFEQRYLIALLGRYGGSIKDTALHAGLSSKHVRSLIKRHGIDRHDFRPALRSAGAKAARAATRHLELIVA